MSQIKLMLLLGLFTAVLGIGITALAIYKPTLLRDLTTSDAQPVEQTESRISVFSEELATS